MKASELEVGACYQIRYRTNMSKQRGRSYYSSQRYLEPLKDGFGILKSMGGPYHTFELVGDGSQVFATSSGVVKRGGVRKKAQLPTKSAQDILDEKILKATKESLREELRITQTWLSGLGVVGSVTEVDEILYLLIDSGNAMKLNAVLETVYSKLIESGEFV